MTEPELSEQYCCAGGIAIVRRDGWTWLETPKRCHRPLTPARARAAAMWLERWADDEERQVTQ